MLGEKRKSSSTTHFERELQKLERLINYKSTSGIEKEHEKKSEEPVLAT